MLASLSQTKDQKPADDVISIDVENNSKEEHGYEEENEETGREETSKQEDPEFELEIDGVPQSIHGTADNVSTKQQSQKDAEDKDQSELTTFVSESAPRLTENCGEPLVIQEPAQLTEEQQKVLQQKFALITERNRQFLQKQVEFFTQKMYTTVQEEVKNTIDEEGKKLVGSEKMQKLINADA